MSADLVHKSGHEATLLSRHVQCKQLKYQLYFQASALTHHPHNHPPPPHTRTLHYYTHSVCRFHGKFPSKNKQETRLQKAAEEIQRRKNATSEVTQHQEVEGLRKVSSYYYFFMI